MLYSKWLRTINRNHFHMNCQQMQNLELKNHMKIKMNQICKKKLMKMVILRNWFRWTRSWDWRETRKFFLKEMSKSYWSTESRWMWLSKKRVIWNNLDKQSIVSKKLIKKSDEKVVFLQIRVIFSAQICYKYCSICFHFQSSQQSAEI